MPAFDGHVGERAVAVVAIEDVGDPVEVVGMTVGAVAGLLLPAIAVVLERPVEIAGDEQIEPAVVVVIEEAGARAPSAGGDAGLPGDVGERAVPVVAIERVAAVARDVEIREAVVVVVSHRDAHAVMVLWHSGETGLLRHVDERAIVVLPVQPVPESAVGLVGRFAVRHGIVDLRAVREEHVQTAVVVVVQQRHAAPHGLNQVLARGGGVLMLEVDARRLGDVGELHIRSGCGAHDEARVIHTAVPRASHVAISAWWPTRTSGC